MTSEEKLDLLPELLELENGSDVLHTESEPKVKGVLEPEMKVREDFGNRSGWEIHPHCLYMIVSPVWSGASNHTPLTWGSKAQGLEEIPP